MRRDAMAARGGQAGEQVLAGRQDAPQCLCMDRDQPPILDMTPDGEFRAARFQAGGFRLPWPTKVFLAAIAVSLVAGVVASFALLIYLALLLIPVALVVGAVGYVALRVQAFRARGTRTVARF